MVGPLSVVASTVARNILPLAIYCRSHCCRSHYILSHYILWLYTADASLYNRQSLYRRMLTLYLLATVALSLVVPLSLVARSTFALMRTATAAV